MTKNRKAPLLVVQLEPLDRSRVEKFACGIGVPNPHDFVAALDKRHAWEFARGPLDVVDLANFWIAHSRLGSLTELIEHDIECKLRRRRNATGTTRSRPNRHGTVRKP